jgi:hypothetical protein
MAIITAFDRSNVNANDVSANNGTATCLRRAARVLLKPHIATMRTYAVANPIPRSAGRRASPTKAWIWGRYVTTMVTVQTRMTADFWTAMNGDPDWRAVVRGGPERCPSGRSLYSLLSRHGVRFPRQKADRMRHASGCDFDSLAAEVRQTFGHVHDKGATRERRRAEEVRLAVLVQEVLGGCGVAPKVSRLALLGAREITQVIPIDSRWQTSLAKAGHVIDPGDLVRESSYRRIEDVLCEVSHELGVRPCDADGVGFGWVLGEEV